jgi:hypothetical protein
MPAPQATRFDMDESNNPRIFGRWLVGALLVIAVFWVIADNGRRPDPAITQPKVVDSMANTNTPQDVEEQASSEEPHHVEEHEGCEEGQVEYTLHHCSCMPGQFTTEETCGTCYEESQEQICELPSPLSSLHRVRYYH